MREWPAGVATSAFVPYSIGRPQTVFSPTAYAIIASRQEFHQAGLPRNSALCSTKAPGSVAGDTQTFAALVAGNAGNTICTADKEFEVAADDANVAGARDSNCLCRRLEPLWAQICPPTRLITQNGYHWFTVYFHAS